MRAAAILAGALVSLVLSPALAQPRPVGLCEVEGRVLALVDSELRTWPENELVRSWPSLRPLALACDTERVAVAFPSRRGGRFEILSMEDLSAEPTAKAELRRLPSSIHLLGGQVVAVAQHRDEDLLYIVPPVSDERAAARPLPEAPSALAMAPDGEHFLVATGETVRRYDLPGGYSREVLSFPAPLSGLASRTGDPRILASAGRQVMLLDLRDPRRRGALPVRAETTAPGPVAMLLWLGGGDAIAVVSKDPARVSFYEPTRLQPAGRVDLDAEPAFAVAAGPGRVIVMGVDGTIREALLDPTALVAATKMARRPPPRPERPKPPAPARGAERTPTGQVVLPPTRTAEPPADKAPRPDQTASPPPEETVSREPAVESASPEDVAPPTPRQAETPSTPMPEPEAAVTPPPEEAATAPEPEPAVTPPPEEAATAREPEPAVTPPPEEAATAPEPEPVASPPSGEAVPVPVRATEEPSVGSPPTKAEPPPSVEPPAPPEAKPGSVVGLLSGRAELVGEVVVLGPDNILRERARVAPRREEGLVYFVVEGLEPGTYWVQPAGPDGASLATAPSRRAVEVSAERGARADFEVRRAW